MRSQRLRGLKVPFWESERKNRVLGLLKLQREAERWSSGCQTMRNCFQPLPRNHSLMFRQCYSAYLLENAQCL